MYNRKWPMHAAVLYFNFSHGSEEVDSFRFYTGDLRGNEALAT